MAFWFYIFLIPFLTVVLLFIAFWITQEGSRWQKHKILGPFARFIQASAGRAFMTFLILTILVIPCTLGLMQGIWMDVFDAGGTPSNTTDIVNLLLIMFLLLAFMIAVLWGSFSSWRQSVRSAADVRVITTQ